MNNLKWLILIIFFISCSVKKIEIGEKLFVDEDKYIIKALVLENENKLIEASKIYDFLYKKTNKFWYFDKEIEDLFFVKKYNKILELTKKIKKLSKKSFKYRIFSLLELKKDNEAKKELLTYFNKKESLFYELMSYILVNENKLSEAVKYIKSLYALNHNKKILLSLCDLLIKLKKYNEALAYLRTHLKMYGCDKDICKRLAEIYREIQDFENLAYIYSIMGKYDKKFLLFALKIYIDIREYYKAINLVNKYHLGDEYKLLVYESFNKYKKAANLSFLMYEKTKNLSYLLKYCVYE